MPGRILLDTSILVDFLRGDQSLGSRIGAAEGLCTSVIAVGELLYGVKHSANSEANLQKVEALSSGIDLFPCDEGTAEVYSRLKYDLRRAGRPIPDNDLWIAATAVQRSVKLVSRDEHYSAVAELDHSVW